LPNHQLDRAEFRRALTVANAWLEEMEAPRQAASVRYLEMQPQPELYSAALVSLFQKPCLGRRALARVYLQETYLVCLEACPSEPAWHVG
jgi:hypothetical protein